MCAVSRNCELTSLNLCTSGLKHGGVNWTMTRRRRSASDVSGERATVRCPRIRGPRFGAFDLKGHRARWLLRAPVVHNYKVGANLSEAAKARRDGPNEPRMVEDPPDCVEEGFHGPHPSNWALTNVNQGHRTVGVETCSRHHLGLRSRTTRMSRRWFRSSRSSCPTQTTGWLPCRVHC